MSQLWKLTVQCNFSPEISWLFDLDSGILVTGNDVAVLLIPSDNLQWLSTATAIWQLVMTSQLYCLLVTVNDVVLLPYCTGNS